MLLTNQQLKLNLRVIAVFFAITSFFTNQNLYSQDGGGALPTRDNIEAQYKWNLLDIYETENAWEADFKHIEDNLVNYEKYQGKLGESSDMLLELIKFDEELNIKMSRLFLYSNLLKDLDLGNADNQVKYDRSTTLYSKLSAANSFINPELLSIPEEKLLEFINNNTELKIYKHAVDNLLRTKEHTLSKELEELMALSSPVTSIPSNIFGIFKNAELPYPKVKGEDGAEIQISDGRYYAGLYSTNREYRERVYRGYYQPYMDYKNTFGTMFNSNLKAISFNAKARKYKSNRAAALDANNIPLSVYDNLVNTVNENVKPLNRWCDLKKKVLGIDNMHAYDTYVTLFPSVKREYNYDESKEILLDALKPLGEDYLEALKLAFDNQWIDVFETKGKRSGAYSSGVSYGVHPYVLLNWNDQLNDLFTFAHEMGHNMHSYFTEKNQPYPYANYSIFVAEVASTTNEAMLLDYLIEKAETKEEKLALIEKHLNNITTTFYRQTRFAAFEQWAHETTEAGEALTPEILSEKYGEMYQHYWGASMVVDEEEKYTWARIPHFYYNFYVYQYATSFAASEAIAAQIEEEGQPAIDRYLEFLKSGSSDYPIEVLKKAGVDMNSPEVILAVVKKMNQLLDQMEKLLAE